MSSLARLEGDPSWSASTLLVRSLALRRLSLASSELTSPPDPHQTDNVFASRRRKGIGLSGLERMDDRKLWSMVLCFMVFL